MPHTQQDLLATPLVSVVIPTYNRPKQLRRAIQSVVKQSYPNIELIVVDDHSPSPAKDVIRPEKMLTLERVEVIRHEENKGANAARRTGIAATSGEYIAFLDDDDTWFEDKLSAQAAVFNSASADVGLVFTGMEIVDEGGNVVRETSPSEVTNWTRSLLCRNRIGSFSTVMVRAEVINDVGSPDEAFPSWQDLEWYIRISMRWDIESVSEKLVTHHSATHDQLSDDIDTLVARTYPLFLQKFRPIASDYGLLFERKMKGWAAFRVGGWYALPNERYTLARRFLLQSIFSYPFAWQFYIYLGFTVFRHLINSFTNIIGDEFTYRGRNS